jgi:tetratricopeptide (TPR) repeat protein
MLGTVSVFFFFVVTTICAFMGALGTSVETWVLEALNHLKEFEKQHEAFETLGKVSGIAITLLTGAYAIYQKYYFAEFNMHNRLDEFQKRVEARLRDTNLYIDTAVQRPSPHRKFEAPIFEGKTLNRVLRQMKWGWWRRADKSLQGELKELTEQLKSWDGQKRAYTLRKAQACLVKGAIAAARAAERDGPEAQKANDEARDCFQQAFELSNKTDVEALEYVGHQQVRLGEYGPALVTFQQLADMAPQRKSLLRARALKFQAEVYECTPSPNWGKANGVLIEAVNNALPTNAPDLEKAEIHEMHGRVRYKLDQLNAEESYIEARHTYQRFIRSNPSREYCQGGTGESGQSP